MVELATLQIGSLRYNSPMVQVALLGFVVFCTVGMFSAVSNLGAGGTQDIVMSNIANSILYATFAFGGLGAGAVTNLLGPRYTLLLGSLGYAFYIGSLWCFQTQGTKWFVYLGGAVLGACASLLWSAQGCLMMAIPSEKDKGKAFSLFWAIFNSGSLMGALIVLGITAQDGQVSTISTGIYLAFLIIMLIGAASTMTILPLHKIVRGDGTAVSVQAQATLKEEITGMWKVIKDWRMIVLLPMFFASNYFYAYQGALNVAKFNGRTRALVAVLDGLGAILGAIFVGLLLDKLPFARRKRGMIGVATVFFLGIAVWGGGLGFQLGFTRESKSPNWDWTDKVAHGPIVLYMSYYIMDSAFQGLAYWIMGALSNDPWKLARFAGLYKAVQSAGGAISYGMDAVKTPYLTEHLVSALLFLVSLPLAGIVVYTMNETTTEIEGEIHVEDLHDSHMAVPKGHHTATRTDSNDEEDKLGYDEKVGHVSVEHADK